MGVWSSLVEMCYKANLNFCGPLIMAILSGSELQSFIVLGKKLYV